MSEMFYMTLLSDGVSHVQSENAPHKFKIHLSKMLELEGRWEVGLAELFFPMTMPILDNENCVISIHDHRGHDDDKLIIANIQPPYQEHCYYDNESLFGAVRHSLEDFPIDLRLKNGHLQILSLDADIINLTFSFSPGLLIYRQWATHSGYKTVRYKKRFATTVVGLHQYY
jgi:hypothetical protein